MLARRDSEDHSRSATTAVDSTAPHRKADDAPDPDASGHEDAPGGDADATHKSNDGDTGNERAKDDAADKDGQHEPGHDHDANKGVDGSDDAPDWSDQDTRDKWFDDCDTLQRPPNTDAVTYQHRVLGTDVERVLVADHGDTVVADAVKPDGTAYTAYDAKHTAGGSNSMYEGGRPPFIQEKIT
ncbi:hypothetical protein [Actinomyces glycerinitolerans]|uniref:Uncharacterized protein n=1 Tax=Actinomyces glycerinitolerans TaxID=1892869 RepID=A0A1M4S381_9ACTO|nr:hypothetical protein [Actinomyces glycerinitolerans]SHE26609.1 Hypothetical protein ACGLYG10_2860 [Actinomyces glycerinitolerans]